MFAIKINIYNKVIVMNERVERLEIKRLIQEYSFLLIDDEYKQEVIWENKMEFLEKIQKLKAEMGITYDYEQDEKNEDEIRDEEEKKQEGETQKEDDGSEEKDKKINKKSKIDPDLVSQSTKEKVKKIYREIAKKTHPDRTKSEKLINFYLRATEAADEYNLLELFIICMELNIEIGIDKEDKDTLEALIEIKKK